MEELGTLWDVHSAQTDIIRYYKQMVEAKGDLEHRDEIRFETGADRDFIDLSDSYVEVKFQVVIGDGACSSP